MGRASRAACTWAAVALNASGPVVAPLKATVNVPLVPVPQFPATARSCGRSRSRGCGCASATACRRVPNRPCIPGRAIGDRGRAGPRAPAAPERVRVADRHHARFDERVAAVGVGVIEREPAGQDLVQVGNGGAGPAGVVADDSGDGRAACRVRRPTVMSLVFGSGLPRVMSPFQLLWP